jgi:hypothetical protein
MIKKITPLVLLTGCLYLTACQSNSKSLETADSLHIKELSDSSPQEAESNEDAVQQKDGKIASAAEILARPQVPILCYHQIRNWTSSDGKVGKDYIVPIAEFKAQMKMLADSGYNTILPDQLYNYLAYGDKLPEKSIMLTFDDTKLDQWTVAIPELKKYGFKGVFFIR